MMFEELLARINETDVGNVYLYLIVRSLKPDTSARTRVTERYNFDLRQIDIDDTIRKHLRNLTVEILEKNIEKKPDIYDYSPISDSSQRVFTYSMENNAISFSSVIEKHESGQVEKVHDFGEIVRSENLWAYCVAFYDDAKDEWVFTFKKVKPGQAVVDEDNPGQRSHFGRIRTRFNSNNDKLEVLNGETFVLEKSIDCFFYDKSFLIISKSAFEEIVDLKVEQERQARECFEELKELGFIEGLELVAEILDGNHGLHKKLVRMQSIGSYKAIDIEKIKSVIKELELELTVTDDKIVITAHKDIDLVIKLLAEFYKQGLVSGETFGTFAGVKIA